MTIIIRIQDSTQDLDAITAGLKDADVIIRSLVWEIGDKFVLLRYGKVIGSLELKVGTV